jgi:tetratricopeptide (TPR) repeat protein
MNPSRNDSENQNSPSDLVRFNAVPDRTVPIVAGLFIASLAGWWVQSVRSAGGLSLPYARADIIIVNFLCMLPLAMIVSEWIQGVLKYHSPGLYKIVNMIALIGAVGIVAFVLSSSQISGTLSAYDAWESLILRPLLAFWLNLSLLLTAGLLFRTEIPEGSVQPGKLVWGTVCLIALLVPAFYIQSRVDEMAGKVDEYLGSGRLGDARQLVREVCILSPWGKIGGQPAGDVARDLDHDCYGVGQSLAVMNQQAGHTEESTYHRARLLAILGEDAAAVDLLRPWYAKSTASPLISQLLGNIYQQQHDWADSQQAYCRALNAWEKLPASEQRQAGIVAAWKGIAFAERKRGNYEAAETAYLSALSLAPTADQHFLLAQFYEDTQQTAKAREHAHQAMALNATRYGQSGQKLITSLQQQHFGCLQVWRKGSF